MDLSSQLDRIFLFLEATEGREFDDLKKMLKPHINPRTNELWAPTDTDPNKWTIDEIVKAMQPVVRKMARKFESPGYDVEDAMQSGYVGLLRALGKDEKGEWRDKGIANFPSFAQNYIWREIGTDVERRIGRKGDKVKKCPSCGWLSKDLERCDKCDTSLAGIPETERFFGAEVSASTPIKSKGEGKAELADILTRGSENVVELIHRKDILNRIMERAKKGVEIETRSGIRRRKFEPIHQTIVELMFGLNDEKYGIEPTPEIKRAKAQEAGRFARGEETGHAGEEIRGTTEVANIMQNLANEGKLPSRVDKSGAKLPWNKQAVNTLRSEAMQMLIKSAEEFKDEFAPRKPKDEPIQSWGEIIPSPEEVYGQKEDINIAIRAFRHILIESALCGDNALLVE